MIERSEIIYRPMIERSEIIYWLSGAEARAQRADRRHDRISRSEVRP